MKRHEMAAPDPDAAVPPAVKAAAARAEELQRQIYSPEPPVPPEPGAPEPPVPPVTPEGNPTPPVVDPPAPPDPPAEVIDWEHRFNSMKGRHDKAQESIRQMSDQIQSMQNVIATMSVATPPATKLPAELDPKLLITPQEEAEYGPEFLNLVERKARAATAGLEQQLADLKSQLSNVGGNMAQSARDSMFRGLDDQSSGVPDWRVINKDPKFLHWLDLPDTYSGAIRLNLLKAAFERNDTPRVLAFFKGFLAEEAALDPATRGPGIPPVPTPTSKVPLESLAAPGRAKTAAEIPAEKPIVTRPYITQFYAEVAAGKYRGNEPEKNRIENEIFAAQREGRITG